MAGTGGNISACEETKEMLRLYNSGRNWAKKPARWVHSRINSLIKLQPLQRRGAPSSLFRTSPLKGTSWLPLSSG